MGRMGDEAHGAFSAHSPGESAGVSGWTTTKQAAKVLGVSRRSVQGYVRRGLLEAREEGEGVNKTFFISIDSLNALRNRRNSEAPSPNNVADVSSGSDTAANASANSAEMLRHTIDRLEARTVEATELRIRLELTERTQSSLEEELREERRRREEAEKRAVELERQLEPAQEPQNQPESAEPSGSGEGRAEPEKPTERRSWWRIFRG
jgi:hypothetical protein